ncbi:hypothetical protein [Streptomyces chattanoogensis]|uniref:hypothetical protein n=1 Tax=Streptomyces chattanoogensis TaxID=66876 RepID=UPI0036A0B2E9
MHTMKRSLALAATTIAVAGITFAGVAPANAAVQGRDCIKYMAEADKHETLGRKYLALVDLEKRKAHPDIRKIQQYAIMADDEYHGAQVFRKEYAACMRG